MIPITRLVVIRMANWITYFLIENVERDLMNDSTDVSNMSSSTSTSNSSDNEIENDYEAEAKAQRNKRHIAFKNNSQLIQHMSDGYRFMNETSNNFSHQTNTSALSTTSHKHQNFDKHGNLNLPTTHLQTSSFILYHKVKCFFFLIYFDCLFIH